MATAATKLAPSPRTEDGFFHSPGRRRTVLSLLLTLLTLLAYNPAAHNDFVTFDDPAYITGNQHVRAGLTWDSVKWAFHSTEHANWHPLTWLSHALDCQLFHLKPAGHHYMSVLLHAICAVLLFLFLEAATGMAWRGAVVAALFAVHPINVESVAWVSERKSVLCMLFFALTLLAYRWYAQNPNLQRYGLVGLLFILGLMSKPMVVTLPFVLLLLDYWPLRRARPAGVAPNVQGQPWTPAATPTPWTRLVLEKLPLLALSAASAVITMVAQQAGGALRGEYSFWARLLNAIVSYARYIEKAVWPSRLAAFYPHPDHSLPAWQVTLSALLLVSITAAVLYLRRSPYLTVGWFWYLGTMVPVIGLVQVGEQGMADRYAYIPLIGLFIAAVWGIADWARARRVPPLYLGLAAAVPLLGFSAITQSQIGYWKSSVALWSHTLAVTERNYVAHDSMGAELIDQGRIPEAMAQFQAAAAISPNDAFSQLDLGVCEKRQGHIQAAVERYQTALRLSADPSLKATALGNLGSIYRASGDYTRAQESYEAALSLMPDNKFALLGLGLIAQKTGDLAQAIDFYSRAVKSEQSAAEYLLLAQALDKAGRLREAQIAYGEAQKMSPDLNATEQAVSHLLQE
jgi:tetratricopeptide (TPR) repeat protein